MFGNLGFSYVGLIFMIMFIVSNLFWANDHSQDSSLENERRILVYFEKAGQVFITVSLDFF